MNKNIKLEGWITINFDILFNNSIKQEANSIEEGTIRLQIDAQDKSATSKKILLRDESGHYYRLQIAKFFTNKDKKVLILSNHKKFSFPFNDVIRVDDLLNYQINTMVINKVKDFYAVFRIWQYLILSGYKISLCVNSQSPIHYTFSDEYSGMNTLVNTISNSQLDISHAIISGNVILTQGPVVFFSLKNENEKANIGDTINHNNFTLLIYAETNKTFGEFDEIMVIIGNTISKSEEILFIYLSEMFRERDIINIQEAISLSETQGYIRIEAISKMSSGKSSYVFTNPIWFYSNR